jgi:hypothetical protein
MEEMDRKYWHSEVVTRWTEVQDGEAGGGVDVQKVHYNACLGRILVKSAL